MFYLLTCDSVNGPPVTDPDFAPSPLPGVGLHKTVPNSLFGNVFGVFVALVVVAEVGDLNEDQKKIFDERLNVAMCIAGKVHVHADCDVSQTSRSDRSLQYTAMIVNVADVSPLFEPLDELPQEALNKGPALYSLDCVSIISPLLFVDQMWEPGQSLLDCLKNFLTSYSHKGYNLFALEWLISSIEERGPVQKLRFAVGDEVECFMGFERGWQRGKVHALWVFPPNQYWGAMKNPYEVLLDGTGSESVRKIYAP